MRVFGLVLGVLLAACTGAPAPVTPARGIAASPALMSTAELASRMEVESLAVIDVRAAWTNYLQNHLPGAAWLNIETLRATDGRLPFQLLPPEAYALLFGRLGLRAERPVVVYSAGDALDIDATFTAWLLAAMGQRQVYLLDGGYAKWQLENRALSQQYPHTIAGPYAWSRFAPERVTLAEVLAARTQPDVVLLDARPPEQYAGQAGAQIRRGHIPGAINHPWKDDLETRDLALVWKAPDELRASYAAQGVTPDKDVIAYCNSGTEASHLFFALKYLLGYPRVRIYTGSWTEWSEREELPIETTASH